MAGKTLHLQINLNCPILNSKGDPSERAKTIDKSVFKTIGTAKRSEKDDLKKVSGIGPFIEKRLNGIEIYTFQQIASMTSKIEEEVNDAIGD